MRCFVMFVTAVCVLFLLKLKWPKNKSFYDSVYETNLCIKFSLSHSVSKYSLTQIDVEDERHHHFS